MTGRLLASGIAILCCGAATDWRLEIEQITHGPKHHFFGYIGHVQNIPWNGSGRWIAVLRSSFQDHMPGAGEAAEIVLLDTRRNYEALAIDKTHAFNIQQGTMMYWNPEAQETQLFFNDRDLKTGKVFTVLYDVAKRNRVKEFRFDDTPFGNSGVAQRGGRFLGINYGRLAKLRAVTGYKGAYDWTNDEIAPSNDGIFLVDVNSGKKRLLVSFKQLADAIRPLRPDIDRIPLFINHTLWSRDDTRIYFYARGRFDLPDRINYPFTIKPDGTGLTLHSQFIGGHPEWESGTRVIGDADGKQVIYDVDKREIVGRIGTPEILPKPGGDVSLSPDGQWFVNGYREGDFNYLAVLHRTDASWQRIRASSVKGWSSGDLRLDPSPTWNRTNNAVLFPALAADGTRQSFLMRIVKTQ